MLTYKGCDSAERPQPCDRTMPKEYRCTRNALYQHDCTGRDDLRERQGHYIWAESEEEAWEKMAIRFPEETEGFDVRVVEMRRDEDGNIIE